MDHYVGPVDDALFVGIAVADRDASDAEPRTVAVYLCDSRDVSQWIFEEVAGQEANLEAGDTRVDVTFAEDRISGTVAMGDGEPQPFTADLATGEAGLYRASYSLGGDDYHLDWIVLADGRRRGPLDGKGNDIPPPPPPSLQ
jgi:flavin-dependent dehydrogenase